MEEIVSSEAIQGEILDDARKKAARTLEEAGEEAERNVREIEAKAAAVVEDILRSNEAKSARYRMETMARFPLERTRMRTVFVSERLAEASRGYIAALSEEKVASLAESLLSKGRGYLAGAGVEIRRKGISERAAREIAARVLGGSSPPRIVEDEGLAAPGLVARSEDGLVTLKATMDLVEESLLGGRRGELARALCGEALSADASRVEERGVGAAQS